MKQAIVLFLQSHILYLFVEVIATMNEAANVPLPPRTASPEAHHQIQDPNIAYTTSLHSFVTDDLTVDLEDLENWQQPQTEEPELPRRRSNSYGDIDDRSNVVSR